MLRRLTLRVKAQTGIIKMDGMERYLPTTALRIAFRANQEMLPMIIIHINARPAIEPTHGLTATLTTWASRTAFPAI
ncbi:MAG: hypothetical protein WAM09_16730 [Anaerolineales bacterium]|jgi:hypothetical protein